MKKLVYSLEAIVLNSNSIIPSECQLGTRGRLSKGDAKAVKASNETLENELLNVEGCIQKLDVILQRLHHRCHKVRAALEFQTAPRSFAKKPK